MHQIGGGETVQFQKSCFRLNHSNLDVIMHLKKVDVMGEL